MRSLENYLNNSSGWPRKLKQNLELALLYQIHYILVFIYDSGKHHQGGGLSINKIRIALAMSIECCSAAQL